MREIKFRAWEKPMSNEWCQARGISYVPDFKGQMLTMPLNSYFGLGRFFGFLDKEQHTLMQYTGLKDKNKKEIYEGDVLGYLNPNMRDVVKFGSFDNEKPFDENHCGVGFYVEDADGEISRLEPSDDESVEIIGNIYSNPELLKKG